jgi:hypothetical protein
MSWIGPPAVLAIALLLSGCGNSDTGSSAVLADAGPDAHIDAAGGEGGVAGGPAGGSGGSSAGGAGGTNTGGLGGAAGAAGEAAGGSAGSSGGSGGSGGSAPTLTPFEEILTYDQVKQVTALDYPFANIDGPMSSYVSDDGNRYWLLPYNYNDGVYLARTGVATAFGFDDLVGQTQERWGQWLPV